MIGALLLSSVASVRRHLYEIFQKLHLVLAAMLIAVIYLHSPSKKLLASPTVYLLAAICVHIFTASLRLWQILYRNVRHRAPLSRVTVQTITYKTSLRDTPLSDAVSIEKALSFAHSIFTRGHLRPHIYRKPPSLANPLP